MPEFPSTTKRAKKGVRPEAWLTMSDESTVSYCFECKRPLVEIDNLRQASKRLPDLQHLVVVERC